jgi:predicted nucleic acid-binding protein
VATGAALRVVWRRDRSESGRAAARRARQLSRFLAWLNQNEEITPTAADYRQAATIKAAAARQGSIVELPDCLIAATAARLERPIVTGNTEHFRAIQRTGLELAIENWRTPEQTL